MIHTLKGKTILEFVIWLFGVAKKYGFDVSSHQNEILIEFDLNEEYDSLVNEKSKTLVLSKIDNKAGLTFMESGSVFILKTLVGTRVEFIPNGYYGHKILEPIIDEFAEYWVNLKYNKKKKLVIDDVEKFKLDLVNELKVQNSEIDYSVKKKDSLKYILPREERIKIAKEFEDKRLKGKIISIEAFAQSKGISRNTFKRYYEDYLKEKGEKSN